MIDFDNLPADITNHIMLFREFLNISWDHVIYKIMDEHNWDDDSDFIDDWMQINWELLVERELLENRFTLAQFSTTHLGENILNPGKLPDFMVVGKSDHLELKDIVSSTVISEDKILRLFTFNTWSLKSKALAFGPPFEVAGLVDIETNEIFHVLVEHLSFWLYKIQTHTYMKGMCKFQKYVLDNN
ncbi:putative uncharacterized protein [Waddlia chondrophila 2032/99]|uniref:Uncharacterized protein n=2 Tax=Waddlia chondrophila TaxID=71667 RepID=D6YV40_WADCW|nr:hypothetical protein [Waddlia chondrophila]ADI38001.1 hypothetical protein wcw_0633 [Waddlia chondrophila WSU 86-1044]CCB91861.1 putative uncharacterized protein [Waddlia chondrophila 2032/99]